MKSTSIPKEKLLKHWIAKACEFPGSENLPAPVEFSREWINEASVESKLNALKHFGCSPSVYLRGDKWRVYVNAGTNIWEDAGYLHVAMRKVIRLWTKEGMPTEKGRVELWVCETSSGGYQKRWRKI